MHLSRRGFLLGTSLLAVRPALAAGQRTIRLRLLETSDLHMFVANYDYYHDKQDDTVGLSKVATLIALARGEARNSLLFDNGDIIQGSPLGDYIAQDGHLKPGQTHPMFAAMNLLRYDAATLGNHEFNFGLPFLDLSLAGAKFPFVCANLDHEDGRSYLPPSLVLKREFTAEDGSRHTLRIGVIGFVPPQIMEWDRSHLAGKVRTTDIVEAARKHVPALRRQCDVLIALSHSGIDTAPAKNGFENASFHLASVPGIDVIFTGHSHRVFPGPYYAGRPGVDAVKGTLAGVPAVMPGFWGSHLGLIDLVLTEQNGGWRVAEFNVEARPVYRREAGRVVSLTGVDPAIIAAIAPAHQATIAWVKQPVGQVAYPLNSYFSMLGSEPSLGVVNAAQTWYAAELLKGGKYASLPILSAAAPFKAGGLSPESYVDIPPGPIALRQVADLYVYANTLVVVKITGAQVAEWLERSCGVFNQIDPAKGDAVVQPLLRKNVPTYNFDVISGVTYQIDLTQPARYDGGGKIINPDAHRVVDLRFDGKPINPAGEFLVVTNNYRSDGGGGFPGLDGSNVVLRAPDLNRDAVQRYLEAKGNLQEAPKPTWSFLPTPAPVRLGFAANERFAELLAGRSDITRVGPGQDGFTEYALRLG